MKITYIGHAAFKISVRAQISASSPREAVTIVTDPYAKTIGLSFPPLEAGIVLVSYDHEAHNNTAGIKGDPFVVREPGEYERHGIGIEGFPFSRNGAKDALRTGYILSVEGMRIVFLGGFNQKELTSEQLDVIGVADILLVPVGGDGVAGPKEASNIINQVEPRIVIPMEYKLNGMKKTKAAEVSAFLKEVGGSVETTDAFNATLSALPQDETKIIVLNAKGEK